MRNELFITVETNEDKEGVGFTAYGETNNTIDIIKDVIDIVENKENWSDKKPRTVKEIKIEDENGNIKNIKVTELEHTNEETVYEVGIEERINMIIDELKEAILEFRIEDCGTERITRALFYIKELSKLTNISMKKIIENKCDKNVKNDLEIIKIGLEKEINIINECL